jgi:Glycosyl hydrolases family 18
MKRHARLMTALAAGTAALLAVGLFAPGASASTRHHSAPHRRSGHYSIRYDITALPSRLFAPYFEAYNTSAGGPAALSQASGAKYLSLAFLQTAQAGSCTVYWNGDTSEPVSSSSFGSDISAIQAAGGNVIPSFGGESADTTGTELADSCTNVSAIAQVYENVINTYHVPRIDLDVEGSSLTDTAGINRRNEAIAQVESWAAASNISVQFSYTMPASTTGMTSQDDAVLENAIADHAQISVVNLMTFDYYIGTDQNMVTDTETAAAGTYSELQSLFPSDTAAQVWHMIGVIEMPGIDDFGPDETFTTADATTLLTWAQSKGINTLSFWALQRDNGGCPGTAGADTCSGIAQTTWYFSHVFEDFTALASQTDYLINSYSHQCLDAHVNGAVFTEAQPCNAGQEQWEVANPSGPTTTIVNLYSHQCLDAHVNGAVFTEAQPCNAGQEQWVPSA